MLNACELAVGVQRAAQWCDVADEFIETYGCPFLYAECRLLYGGVFVAKGKWQEAEDATEMARVVTEDGVVAICVPAGLEDQPAYGPLDAAVGQLAGPEAQALMTTYWSCGDLGYLRGLFESAEMTVTSTRTHVGTAKYPSIDDAGTTELEATPLGERISAETYEDLRQRARDLLQRYVADAGSVDIPLAGHIVVARR